MGDFLSLIDGLNCFQALNSICQNYPVQVLAFMFVIGCAVGSFLNVLALRSLKEESIIFPASYCPQCKHTLSPWDNIPVLSYVMLAGKCRYCKCSISWQYPLVELATGLTYAAIAYVFLIQPIHLSSYFAGDFTGDLFKAIRNGTDAFNMLTHPGPGGKPPLSTPAGETLSSLIIFGNRFPFHKFGLALGMLVFASTLITVTVTDFREKLIPHEITYPAMLFGIAFSALVRGDLLGAMAGIGASYIIFDFLAFYGLKLYKFSHPEAFADESDADETKEENDFSRSSSGNADQEVDSEPIEVMGGGDAVLSAVMSAYLGWQGLVLALLIGFVAGTAMGLVLLGIEMKKAGLIKECMLKSLFYALIGGGLLGGLTMLLWSNISGMDTSILIKQAAIFGGMGAISGGLLGMVAVGTRVSKPFPFGPALALGGFVAMFLIPYWLPFY